MPEAGPRPRAPAPLRLRPPCRAGGVRVPDASQTASCLFCQIIAGQRPAEVVFESPSTIAFLDRFPAARGHTLVVPKQHAATLLGLDEGAAGALFGSLFEVMDLLRDALCPVGFNVGWNQCAAAGQHVFRLHVHVLPRLEGGGTGVQAVGEGAGEADVHQVAEAVRRRQRLAPSSIRPRAVPAPTGG